MKTLKLRKQLSDAGLLLFKDGKGWLVTNTGTAKTLSEKKFADLDAVQLWFDSPARRLSEQESDEFDADWAEFCVAENKTGGSDMTTTATSTGWIIEVVRGLHMLPYCRTFYSMSSKGYGTIVLAEALVQPTRKDARMIKFNDGTEVVRKVELDEQGRATQIIPGR